MISLCDDALDVEGGNDAWNEFVMGQGRVDYGDGGRRFIDDSRWWQCFGIGGGPALPAARFGVTRQPQLFLIDRHGRFVSRIRMRRRSSRCQRSQKGELCIGPLMRSVWYNPLIRGGRFTHPGIMEQCMAPTGLRSRMTRPSPRSWSGASRIKATAGPDDLAVEEPLEITAWPAIRTGGGSAGGSR